MNELIWALKDISEQDMQEAQEAFGFLEYAATCGLAVEAMASFIKGIRAGETAGEAVFRARCDWDI